MKAKRIDYTLLLVRLLLAFVMAAHGAQKLFGWFGGFGFEGTMGFFTQTIGLPYLLASGIILIESVGMIALSLGAFSRLLSSGVMAIMMGAIATTHGQHGFFMNWFGTQAGEGFEFHLLVIGLAAVISIHGAGAFSIDALLSKKKHAAEGTYFV
jgi:putative oxidoreductase